MPRRHQHAVHGALLAALVLAGAPPATGQEDLRIHVRYPAEGATVAAVDSTFVFGAVAGARGPATVTVNGTPAVVDEGGGWLAWVPVESGPFAFRVVAEAGGRRSETVVRVDVASPSTAPGPDSLPYKPSTIEPAGPLELYAGDTLRVAVVVAPGWTVRARVGGAETTLVPVVGETTATGPLVWGPDAPAEVQDAAPWASPARATAHGPWRRHAGDIYLHLGGGLTDTLAFAFHGPAGERVEAAGPKVRILDPTEVRVALLHDDTAGTGRTDGRVIARAGPGLGYQLLLPNGTPAATLRRKAGWRQIALGPGTTAWVALEEAHPAARPAPASTVAVVRTRRVDGWSEVVLPLDARLPFRVEQRLDPVRYTIDVYGLVSNVDWIETAADERLLESIRWSQPEDGVFRLDVRLAGERAWGWRARWEGTRLVVGFRDRPAALADRRFRSPLHGVRVVVDPGHNPDTGAVGPTGLEEREANLGISLALAEILDRRGAEVVLTRATADSALGLYDRTNLAVAARGELFVSVHNNALPDGVNPFVHNGTSVLFYHPQSEPLAEAIQAALLPATGLRDHGVWHQNLAVARMSEMPAVLVESAFMMIPEQEALLRTPAFRERIAEGIADGIERYLAGGP